MAIKLTSTAQANAENGVKVLVHGPAGSGKTLLNATTGGNNVIISAESGLLSLSRANIERQFGVGTPGIQYDIPVIEIQTLDDLNEAYRFITQAAEAKAFDWVSLDSISEIAENVLTFEKAKAADPRQAYGALQDEMGKIIRAFRDLAGRNVYFSSKQDRVKDEQTGAMLYSPMMPGSKVGQNIPYFFDEVFAYRSQPDPTDTTKVQRALQTARCFQYEAKDRSGALLPFEAPNLGAIRSKIISSNAAA